MKKIISIFILISSVMMQSSCSKWLDVRPKSEIKGEIMFENEQGLRDALIGCYILMSKDELYGSELSVTFVEALAQQYEHYLTNSNNVYPQVGNYAYSHSAVDDKIKRIWLNMYNAIANVNFIIENVDNVKDVISPMGYANIKGEAYALRAYMHFDLMRLFSYGDLDNRKDKLNELSIPYRKTYNKVVTPKLKAQDVYNLILSDLNISADLLSKYDPISRVGVRPSDYAASEDDLFFTDRSFRLNYHGVLATKMRLLMWVDSQNNQEEILTIAEYLIEKGNMKWVNDNIINNFNMYDRDLVFSTEQLFGLEVYKRYENVTKNYFKLTTADNLNKNTQSMYRSTTRLNETFEIAADIGVSDYRYSHLYNRGERNEIIKFWEFLDFLQQPGKYSNIQPLIRTPEVYYMAAEVLLNQGTGESHQKAVEYLNKVRNQRGISISKNLSNSITSDVAKKELEKEWRKEFMGDGQLFYFYKRKGYASIKYGARTMDDNTYVIPIPLVER